MTVVIFVGILNAMILLAKVAACETKITQPSKDMHIFLQDNSYIPANLNVLPNKPRVLQASFPNSETRNLTGRYTFASQLRTGVLDVQLLPDGKIKFHLSATYSPPGNSAGTHTGGASEVVSLESNTAVYSAQDCKITMEFFNEKAVVKQEGSCGFGLNVFANGTYVKRSNQIPQFDDF